MRARRSKAPAPKDFLADEPFVVVFVKLRFEAGIGRIIRYGPFPHVADHLVASIGAPALWKSANLSGPPERVLKQVGGVLRGRIVSPGELPLGFCLRVITGCLLPFRLRWQAFAGPLCIS